MSRPATLCEAFDGTRLTTLRHVVGRYATAWGLHGDRLEDFTVAVTEMLLNAVRHGGGEGTLRMWLAGQQLICVVTDHGPGIPAHALTDGPLPSPLTTGGRGLRVARRLCDDMTVTSGPDGTAVRLVAAVLVAPTGGRPLSSTVRTAAD